MMPAWCLTAFAVEETLQHELYQPPPPAMPPQEVRTRERNTIDMGDSRPSTSAGAEAEAEAGGEEAAATASGSKRRRREPSNAVRQKTATVARLVVGRQAS
jgi:hypothetical protein